MHSIYKLFLSVPLTGVLLVGMLASLSPARADFGFSGVEFSPVRTFISAGSENFNTYSGTLNFELSDPTTEIAVPVMWSKAKLTAIDDGYEGLVVDVQWRKFDKPSRDGGYVGVLARGVSTRSFDLNTNSQNDTRETDIGLGLVAGFRRNISSGFYWGSNASIVAFSDDPSGNGMGEAELYRQKVSFTFDFLKIGYQF